MTTGKRKKLKKMTVTGWLGRTQVHRLTMVTGQSKCFIGRTDDQGRTGRVNGDRQEFGNRQAIG